MNARINFQTIMGNDGKPAFVVVPIDEFRRLTAGFTPGMVPHVVVNRVFDEHLSTMAAWRDFLRLTQAEVAARMGISQAAYAQMEISKRPRKTTLKKVADAMGLELAQLLW